MDGAIERNETELQLLNDASLDVVASGVKGKFHYVEMGGDTYAIGYNSNGEKLFVKVT